MDGLVVGLAARGDGVTADGRFVPGAAPGDTVLADGSVAAGPGRAVPPCRHFGRCGGCQLQHVTDPVIADFARDRCLRPLAAVGITPDWVARTHMSPPRSRRRAAMRAVREGGRVVLGFAEGGTNALIDVEECHVLHPALFALLTPLRALLARLATQRATVGVTLTLGEGGADVLLANVDAAKPAAAEALAAFAAANRVARLSVEGADGLMTVADQGFAVRLGGVPVALPPGGFLQATADGEAALVAAVRETAGKAGRAIDLFAGAGTFALPLAAAGARVTAADAAGPAIAALDQAARRAGLPVQAMHRDLFRRPYLAAELKGFEAAVIDPPRSGAASQTAELAASGVARVAAVSCNPATFARDAERLVAGGFRLARLWPVAQFRWSTHVELAAEFVR